MSKEQSIDRRKFLVDIGVIGFFGAVLGSYFVGRPNIRTSPGLIVDTTIKDIPFKLHGMAHCREFAEKYHDSLDDLVKNASLVVSEGTLGSKDMSDTAKPYFETIWRLCKKYDKPLINLDPGSQGGMMMEMAAGMIGAISIAHNAPKIITKSPTRREVIKNSLKTAAGFYFCMSSFIYGIGLKGLVDKNYARREKYYYNHITDQRNVEIANRLLKLPNMLSQDDFNNGDYVLVDYGRAHIPGIMHYLKSPIMRKIKTAMYAPTYGWLDSDKITIYRHNGKSWERKDLN